MVGKTRCIMIQGTMSNAGKSLIAAGLCRIFKQDGYRVAPFKSQNMALNSYITKEGLEMGRAQVMQAEAAGIEPSVAMNPILLKPTNDIGSQVIVNGEVLGNMSARDYFSYKKKLIPDILKAYHRLEEMADIIVIEGAGSPAEINLKENDIVNMGLAELIDAPVLIAGDIDRGGVFAQLLGTHLLLEEEERARVKGFIINKFRGDLSILAPGIRMLEERGGVPVVGVVPYMQIHLEDEDSLTTRFDAREEKAIDIAVIRFPRISNFTDFTVFEQFSGVSLRYVDSVEKLSHPDMIILPGSKNTMEDLRWMRQNGLEAAVKKRKEDAVIFGICGGYQMLGEYLEDPHGVESGGILRGMELLPVRTVIEEQKIRTQVTGEILAGQEVRLRRTGEIPALEKVTEADVPVLAGLAGLSLEGYEIHMGRSKRAENCQPFCRIKDLRTGEEKEDGAVRENVYGTYVHGIFDRGMNAKELLFILAQRKGIGWDETEGVDYAAYKESQYDKLAETLREYLDMDAIYRMIGR